MAAYLRRVEGNSIGVMAMLFRVLAAAAAAGAIAGCESGGSAGPSGQPQYAFWPPAPDQPRVQFLTSYQKASDNRISHDGGKLNEFLYGKETVVDLPINKPYGLAYWDGRIYVTDLRGAGVMVLDLKKRETRLMGSKGAGAVKRAVAICVGADGTKYVADIVQNAILVFDANERFVKMFTAANLNPTGLAIRGNELFVADLAGHVVKVLDVNTGNQLRTIGTQGHEDGQFESPLSVTLDSQGNLYVVDVLACRVQKFNAAGEFVMGFGQVGARPGDFVRPKQMAVAADGTIFVVDASFNNVQVFDEKGLIMGYFGGPGNYVGAMDLPAGLALVENPADMQLFAQYIHPDFEAQRLVIVSNQFGADKVAVYALGQLKPGRTVAGINASRIVIKESVTTDRSKSPDVLTTQPIDLGSPAKP